MPDKNNCHNNILGTNTTMNNECTCIDVDKIYDSARDKDCIEDLRVYLDEEGQSLIDCASNIRARSVDILDARISVNGIPFNNGYYQIEIRYFFKICFEACVNSVTREFCGIAVFDKQSVLHGGEGSVYVFTSEPCSDDFCPEKCTSLTSARCNNPKVVLEAAKPIVLNVKTVDRTFKYGYCCCSAEQIPQRICSSCFPQSSVCTSNIGCKCLYVSLGLFSIIRIERPVSLLIDCVEFCIPDKESAVNSETDPCALFKNMSFPTCDFFPKSSVPCPGKPRCEGKC